MSRPKKKPEYNSAEVTKQLVEAVSEAYLHPPEDKADKQGHMYLHFLAEAFSMTPIKVRKLLITSGVYETPISITVGRLYREGKAVKEIQEIMGLSRASVNCYLPYNKVVYKLDETSVTADRIRKCRHRKAMAEKLSAVLKTADTQIVHSHLIPRLGEYEMDELTPQLLQRHIVDMRKCGNHRTGGGLAPSTVNLIVAVIQDSLATAHDIDLCSQYIADKIKRPRIEEKKVECFSVAEQKQIEDAVRNDKRQKTVGILLCLYTGLRIGELLALEWTDIDFEKREISISKTCHDSTDENGKYCRFVNAPKTTTSMRVIPFPKQLLPLLRETKKKNGSKYVVGDGEKIISVRSYQRTFELLLKKNGIPHKGFHSLRHTFATRAIECGVDVKTLSEILGHKNPTITLNRYAHSLMEHKKDMMNRLGKLYIEA